MPNYVRCRAKGASYFFTVVTYRRRQLFVHSEARSLLNRSMVAIRRKYPFEMFACVLLPDHLHCLWTLPENDDNFPLRWANIKSMFTKQWLAQGGHELPTTSNRASHHERGVWQPRYWEHRIRDEADWYRHRDYIHLNPVNTVTLPNRRIGLGAPSTATCEGDGLIRIGRDRHRLPCRRSHTIE